MEEDSRASILQSWWLQEAELKCKSKKKLYNVALEMEPVNVRGSGGILGIELFVMNCEFESLGCELFAIIGVRSVKKIWEEIEKKKKKSLEGERERERTRQEREQVEETQNCNRYFEIGGVFFNEILYLQGISYPSPMLVLHVRLSFFIFILLQIQLWKENKGCYMYIYYLGLNSDGTRV